MKMQTLIGDFPHGSNAGERAKSAQANKLKPIET